MEDGSHLKKSKNQEEFTISAKITFETNHPPLECPQLLTLGKPMKLFGILVLTLLANSAHADNLAARVDASCIEDKNDPADLGWRLTENSLLYPNQCINSVRFRPILNFKMDQATASFDNYHHDNTYWKATVPVKKGSVKKVYFHILRFPVLESIIAAHTQLRFVLEKDAVQLERNGQTTSHDDVLISYEAGFPKEVSYNFAAGGIPAYASLVKVMSTVQKQNDNSKNPLEQYELDLTEEERTQLFRDALNFSSNLGMEQFYNTLRPNCTTAAFDLIDGLPRFKGQYKPFLTALSVTDPIAGPSIEALLQRKLISARAQDFPDELQGKFESKPLPPPSQSLAAFLVQVPDQPWSLVNILPDTSGLSETEQKTILGLREKLITIFPTLFQSYASVILLSSKEERGQKLFLNTLKEFIMRLPAVIEEVNENLPEERKDIAIFFVPHPALKTSTDLTPLGIPAALPFAVNDYQLSDADPKTKAIYQVVGQSIYQAGQMNPPEKTKEAFLTGIGITIQLQKNKSKVTTQLSAALSTLENAMESVSPQVTIKKVAVPKMDANEARSSLVITHVQDAQSQEANPLVDVQFGPFGKLAGSQGEFGYGTMQVFKGQRCEQQTYATPYFQGVVNQLSNGDGVLDAIMNFIGQGSPIFFHLLGMDMNLRTMQVEHMDLSVSTVLKGIPLSCMKNEEAETQFAQEANKALKDLMEKSSDNEFVQMLAPLLN